MPLRARILSIATCFLVTSGVTVAACADGGGEPPSSPPSTIDSLKARDTVAAAASAPLDSARSDLPGAFDCILDLPSDWYAWGRRNATPWVIPGVAAIAASTAALVWTDHETYTALKRPYDNSRVFSELSDAAVFIGDGKFQFGIAGAFALYGAVADDHRALRTASEVAEVILACGAVVQLLKHVTGRESPFVATTPSGRWRLLPNQLEYIRHVPHYDAFPSGHVATAVATLTVISENYPELTWLPYAGGGAIAALAVGMVASGIHWWSDYPLSIVLGYQFGTLIAGRNNSEYSSNSSPDTRLGFSLLRDGSPALCLSRTW